MRITKLFILIIVCLLSISVFAQEAKVKTNEDILRAELKKFNFDNPEKDITINLEKKDTRFIGVYNYAVSLPGILTQEQSYIKDKYGVRMIEGTSDAIESDEHAKLMTLAYKYAKEYNQKLLEILKKKSPNN